VSASAQSFTHLQTNTTCSTDFCAHSTLHNIGMALRCYLNPAAAAAAAAVAVTAAAGSGSDTEQQIFHLLHQDKSRLLGLMPPKPAAAADVQQLTTELAGLSSSLAQQQQGGEGDSGKADGGGAELIIANGVWTKGVPVHEQYAAKMLQLFQVCACSIRIAFPLLRSRPKTCMTHWVYARSGFD
jgi:hypothetical protein